MYNLRVVPFVRYEKIVDSKGREQEIAIDNITSEESKNMSCNPVAYWPSKDGAYVAELPLFYNEGKSVRFSLFYVYADLTKEEQELFKDRTIEIPVTKEEIVKVYGEESKRFFGKRKVKEK